MTGFLLGIGLSAAFLLIVLLVAEPLRNLERFTRPTQSRRASRDAGCAAPSR